MRGTSSSRAHSFLHKASVKAGTAWVRKAEREEEGSRGLAGRDEASTARQVAAKVEMGAVKEAEGVRRSCMSWGKAERKAGSASGGSIFCGCGFSCYRCWWWFGLV